MTAKELPQLPQTKEYWIAELHKAFAETERDVFAQMLHDPKLPPEKEAAIKETLAARTAAPELLAALKIVFAEMKEQCVPDDSDQTDWAQTYRRVESAIAKAEAL